MYRYLTYYIQPLLLFYVSHKQHFSLLRNILKELQDLFIFPPFFYQNANIKKTNCVIIDCNLSEKHKLALYQTQIGQPNIDHKIRL